MSDARPLCIPVADWPEYRARLGPALDKLAAGSGGRYAVADIDYAISAGHMQAWVAVVGAQIAGMLVSEMVYYPQMKVLRLIGLVGTGLFGWLACWPTVQEWARAEGCQRIEVLAPPDYDRLLKRLGWETFHVLSEKLLC